MEASLCPDVVVAEIDPKKLKKKQTVNVSVSNVHVFQSRVENKIQFQVLHVGVHFTVQ